MKRTADRTVDSGTDITDAHILFDILCKKTAVKLFKVSEDEVHDIDLLLPSNIKPIAGTMKLHQFQVLGHANISVRDLSCFCKSTMLCDCNDVRTISFPVLVDDQHSVSLEVTPEDQICVTMNAKSSRNKTSREAVVSSLRAAGEQKNI